MSTALQRQKAREDADITAVIAAMREKQQAAMAKMDAIHGDGYARKKWIAAEAARIRMTAPMAKATRDQLALVARHLEPIVAAKHPTTGDIIISTERAVSLVDVMHREKQIAMDMWHAATWFREQFATALGWSKGMASYEGYTQGAEASQRMPTNPQMMQAYEELKQACVATFGTIRRDGKWALDEELMSLVIPAILDDKKDTNRGKIGTQRTAYKGRDQIAAVGGTVIAEVLHKLTLHLMYRER